MKIVKQHIDFCVYPPDYSFLKGNYKGADSFEEAEKMIIKMGIGSSLMRTYKYEYSDGSSEMGSGARLFYK